VDGTVLPCKPCEMIAGNLTEQTFRDIWNGPGFREFRRRTRTRRGLADLRRSCDCGFCCHVGDNARTHRWFRWIAPFCFCGKHGSTAGKSC
jgi:MoaA/NifB/PqqE/SkfB family radical SAM enzyme